MKARFAWLAMVLALGFAFVLTPLNTSAAPKSKRPLSNLPVTGALSDGGAFKGKLSITEFGYNATTGLTVSGKLVGTATKADGTVVKDVSQTFSGVHATLTDGAAGAITAQATCDILNLDLGPLSLNLLGLQVDLARVVLDITAISGAGNLLGNLLCAVAGLLDPGGFLTDLIGGLTALTNLLSQINALL